MPTLTQVHCLCILQMIFICLHLCLGGIRLCSSNKQSLQNGRLVLARKGAQVTVTFCVQADHEVQKHAKIGHTHRVAGYYMNSTEEVDRLRVLTTGNKHNTTVNITISQVEERDFGHFYVTLYDDVADIAEPDYKLTVWFQLKQYEQEEHPVNEIIGSEGHDATSVGAIVGGVVGGIILTTLIVIILIIARRKRKVPQQESSDDYILPYTPYVVIGDGHHEDYEEMEDTRQTEYEEIYTGDVRSRMVAIPRDSAETQVKNFVLEEMDNNNPYSNI